MGAGGIPLHIEKEFFGRAKGKYKVHVYIAPESYEGEDRIDVSTYGGQSILVPPRQLLFDYKFGKITKELFQKGYFEYLEQSYIDHRHIWDTLLNRDRMILVCTCGARGKDCHRYFIIKFLKKLGGKYKGELQEK